MKLLMIYCDKFAYKTSLKALETARDIDEQETSENVLVGFIHIEQKDEIESQRDELAKYDPALLYNALESVALTFGNYWIDRAVWGEAIALSWIRQNEIDLTTFDPNEGDWSNYPHLM